MNKIPFQQLRIVFMGTPAFAVASLQKLVEAGCNIVGVITAPDKQAGRGMEWQQSEVKKYAIANKLLVLQPEKLKQPDFLAQLKLLEADLQVVVAFRMLPEVVWNMPPLGTINVHASLLPQYRGAAPINWAIINGEAYTGITTFKLQHQIDMGNILLTARINIQPTDNAGSLHDKLKILGANLLLTTLQQLADNELTETPQLVDTTALTPALMHAPKLSSDTGNINWQNNADDILNLIRGLSPYPAAYTQLNNKKLKIFSAKVGVDELQIPVGQFITDGKQKLQFGCLNGYIDIIELQLEGKKRMLVEEFLNGYRF